MSIMQWSDELSVGVPEIDRQHKVIINIVNRIHSGCTNSSEINTMKELLPELKWYAEEHFKHEELFMSETNYPNLEEHASIHREMLTEADKLIQKCFSGQSIDSNETIDFLKTWLTNHIKVKDCMFGEHARNIKVI